MEMSCYLRARRKKLTYVTFERKIIPSYGGKSLSSENNFPLLFLPNSVKWENNFHPYQTHP